MQRVRVNRKWTLVRVAQPSEFGRLPTQIRRQLDIAEPKPPDVVFSELAQHATMAARSKLWDIICEEDARPNADRKSSSHWGAMPRRPLYDDTTTVRTSFYRDVGNSAYTHALLLLRQVVFFLRPDSCEVTKFWGMANTSAQIERGGDILEAVLARNLEGRGHPTEWARGPWNLGYTDDVQAWV